MTMGNDLKEIVGDGTAETSFATIDENGIDVDGDQVLIKVTCHPSGSPRTVRLGADYAGPAFGIWTLPKVGDELLCVFPRDAGIGAVLKRMANSVDKIPQDLKDQADKNPVLIIHPSGWKVLGTDEKISLTAGATPVEIYGDDVKIGNSGAKNLCTDDFRTWATSMIGTLNTKLNLVAAHTHGINPPDLTLVTLGDLGTPDASTVTSKVKAT